MAPIQLKKRFSFALLLVYTILYISANGQATTQTISPSLSASREPWHKRITFGGNLAFQVGTVTGISVSPEIRYRLVGNLHAGTRFIYQYFYYKDYYYDTDQRTYLSYNSNEFGGALFLRYYLNGLFNNAIGNLFAHVEYEYLAYTRPYSQSLTPTSIRDAYGYFYTKGNQTVEINSFFVGGGYRQPVSNRVGLDLLVLFNLNDTFNSPYSNPVIRFGVGIGL
jgi:hypothetical protein